MRIYDRWGELLYEGKDLAVNTSNAGWDGNFRGKQMPSGVYTYYVQVLFIDGEVIPYRGDVTILR
jgi:gliding motility-associated-like protein